jgi:glycogen operon protein
MGVDGFRFDLAPVLGRQRCGVGDAYDSHAAFFTALAQDPVLARTRLIAESWDVGPHGYQVGRFPAPWLEWNDRFRDTVRRYWLAPWLSHGVARGEFARRLTASSDLFHHGRRAPTASVNFVACHDGFTLADLTSHSGKRNHPNGEDNRDGRHDELCANLGAEGASGDAAVVETRGRVRRALLATVLLAQGTPMLHAGDEIGRSQDGNNNAWNQDNPLGWIDWAQADAGLARFVADVIALRRRYPLLRCDRWFSTRTGEPQATWFAPDGREMRHADWHDSSEAAFACRLEADHQPVLWMAFNPGTQPRAFALPRGSWQIELDSTRSAPDPALRRDTLDVPSHGMVLLRQTTP